MLAGFNSWSSKVEVPLVPLPVPSQPAGALSQQSPPTASPTTAAQTAASASSSASTSPASASANGQAGPGAQASTSNSNSNSTLKSSPPVSVSTSVPSGGVSTAQEPARQPQGQPHVNLISKSHSNSNGQRLLMARLSLPAQAYEMAFAFHDGSSSVWDSNAGANFYARVALTPAVLARGPMPASPGVPAGGSLKVGVGKCEEWCVV